MDGRLPVVETGQAPNFKRRLPEAVGTPSHTGCLPVVKLRLCHLPLLKASGDVGRSAQDVLDVQEELLRIVTGP